MIRTCDFPLNTHFGESSTALHVLRIYDILNKLSESIDSLKKNITQEKNILNELNIKTMQCKNDFDKLNNSKKELLAKINCGNSQVIHKEELKTTTQAESERETLQRKSTAATESCCKPTDASNNKSNGNENQKQQFLNCLVESTNTKYTQQTVLIRYILNAESVICCVRFDPSGCFLAFADTRSLHIVNSATGQLALSYDFGYCQQRTEVHSRALAFSRDSSLIAVAIAPSSIGLFSLVQQKLIHVFDGHLRTITSILFIMNSSMLVSGGIDGIICIWDLAAMRLMKEIRYGTLDDDMLSSKDGAISSIINVNQVFIVGFLVGTVSVYSGLFDAILYSFQAHHDMLITMSLTNKGELITVSSTGNIKIWTITHSCAACRLLIHGHNSIVTSICSSFNESIFITGSKDETIKGWNSDSGNNIFTIKAHSNTVLSLAHHPNGGMFTSSSGDGLVIAWAYPAISK